MSYTKLLEKIKAQGIEKPHFRFAPSPNGKVTFGHLKGLVILDDLARITKGKLDLRFDDTNPLEHYATSNYQSILDLANSLKIEFNNIVYCSHDLKKYIESVEKIIALSRAYFCKCDPNPGDFKLKCPCSRIVLDTDLAQLQEIPNSVVKFIPLVGEPFVILRGVNGSWYPTMTLQGPVDDYLQGINVILRGRDLESVTTRQKEIYQLLYDKPYPITEYWGRISLWNSKTGKCWNISKSTLGNTSKFPSLEFFNYWGVSNLVLKKFALSYGLTKNDIKLDLLKLTRYLLEEGLSSTPNSKYGYVKLKQGLGFYRGRIFLNYKTWKFQSIGN